MRKTKQIRDLPVDDFTQRMIDSQKVNEISNVIKSMGFVEVKRKPK